MTPKKSVAAAISSEFRKRILSGLLVLVPLGITIFVLSFILRVTVGLVLPMTRVILGDFPQWAILLLSLLILVLILHFVGTLANLVIGRKIIGFSERIVTQIPLVATIYSSSKQVIEVFQSRTATGNRQVVMLEFPAPGMRALGFVTGTVCLADGTVCHTVFVPTTPNPTTGFLQFVRVDQVTHLDMGTEEAFRLIMSGGLLAPANILAAPAAESATISQPLDMPH